MHQMVLDLEFPPVWPDPTGNKRGYEISPLYKRATEAAKADSAFYELLALLDAIREDGSRVRKAARDELCLRFDEYRSRSGATSNKGCGRDRKST
jgi:hypothetical protein